MTLPNNYDVLVIGGGPAGSLTGTYLAQKGYRVALLDKQKHPRYTVGESLIPDFWKYTDAAGVSDKILADGFIQKQGGTVNWLGEIKTHSFKDFGYNRPAMHIERDRFDHILLQNAAEKGVQVFENYAVVSVNFDNPQAPQVRCRNLGPGEDAETFTCRYVVDASGQSAVIGRQLGLIEIDEAFRYMSVWGYFENSKYVAFGGKVHPLEDLGTVPPTTFIKSLEDTEDPGWSWHIVLRGKTSVGFVLPLQSLKSKKGDGDDWEALFLRMCSETEDLRDLLAEARFIPGSVRIIRDYSYRVSELAGPGYFLVGDAAGFVDPIFSVGVPLSMYSAYAAAWAIDRCFRQPEHEQKSRVMYTQQVQGRHEIARSLALPRYISGSEAVSELARRTLKFERNDVQTLMSAVVRLSSRSDNFKKISGETELRELKPEQLIQIDRLQKE